MRRTWALLGSGLVLALVAGCSSDGGAPGQRGANANGPSGPSGPGAGGGTSSSGNTGGGTSSSTPGSTGGSSSTSGGSANGGGTSGSTGSSGTPGGSSTDCTTTALEPTALRRLTKFEYANTVHDLLNVDPSPASDLPADEVSNGYDNDSGVLTVSSLHAEKYVLVSETLAKTAVQNNLSALTAGCDTTTTGEDACALAFAKSFGRRAFRRPTTSNDEQMLMTAYSAGKTGGSYSEGIEVMIRAALQSPDFIYRLETTTPVDATAVLVPLSQFELATRLSYMIWASTPDDALLDAAQNGALATKQQVADKARQMLNDPRAKVGLGNFFNEWSGVTRLSITTKNSDIFPSFSDDMRDAMARELPAFMDYLLYQGDHTLKTLLTKPVAFVSGPLGSVYGLTNAPTGTTPQMVDLGTSQGRSGLLTQAGFLSVQGHPDQTSPVLRGKFVRNMLLCDVVPPPPADVNVSLPTGDQGATARERFSGHATGSCNGCHSLMDPIGFAFENFDAMGQYRTTEGGETIDASGVINSPTDPNLGGDFVGVAALAQKLVASTQVTDCMATQWFRYASGRLEAEPDTCSLQNLRGIFSGSGGDLVELVVGMTQTDDFWYRAPVTQ
jgi:hypothetical protein